MNDRNKDRCKRRLASLRPPGSAHRHARAIKCLTLSWSPRARTNKELAQTAWCPFLFTCSTTHSLHCMVVPNMNMVSMLTVRDEQSNTNSREHTNKMTEKDNWVNQDFHALGIAISSGMSLQMRCCDVCVRCFSSKMLWCTRCGPKGRMFERDSSCDNCAQIWERGGLVDILVSRTHVPTGAPRR